MKKSTDITTSNKRGGVRMVPILYWAVIIILTLMGLTVRDDNNNFIMWPGVFVALAAFPFYVLIGRVAGYAVKTTRKHHKLETSRAWRITKVAYWIVTTAMFLYLLFSTDEYGHNTTANLGVAVLLVSVPLYVVVGKLFVYISDGSRTPGVKQ